MSRRNIDHLLRNSRGILRNIAGEFVRKYPAIEWDEIYDFALEGFYKAIKSFDPSKGTLSTWSYFYCRAWVTQKIQKSVLFYQKKDDEFDLDRFADQGVSAEDRTFLQEVLDKLSPEDAEVLQTFSQRTELPLAMAELNLPNHMAYYKRVREALQRAREIL